MKMTSMSRPATRAWPAGDADDGEPEREMVAQRIEVVGAQVGEDLVVAELGAAANAAAQRRPHPRRRWRAST